MTLSDNEIIITHKTTEMGIQCFERGFLNNLMGKFLKKLTQEKSNNKIHTFLSAK
jgi:hypothetical protein